MLWPVDGRAGVCFPHLDRGDANRDLVLYSSADSIVEVFRDVLGRRVDLIERGQIVDETMVQISDRASDQAVHFQKIHQQAGGVELSALHGYSYAIVVP